MSSRQYRLPDQKILNMCGSGGNWWTSTVFLSFHCGRLDEIWWRSSVHRSLAAQFELVISGRRSSGRVLQVPWSRVFNISTAGTSITADLDLFGATGTCEIYLWIAVMKAHEGLCFSWIIAFTKYVSFLGMWDVLFNHEVDLILTL